MSYYSQVLFSPEIDNRTVNEIETILKTGTKVYFFTYDPIDTLKENAIIRKAMDDQFIFAYEVIYNDNFQNNFTFFDGKVPEEILNFLANQTPYFNSQQFMLEHAPLNKHIIVSAGAGTGKTTAMINRILFLKHINPNLSFGELGLITFTNNAAQQLRSKLIERLKLYFSYTKDMKYLNWIQELKNMTIGTIHSFAQTILHNNIDKLTDSSDLILTSFTYRRRKIIEEVIDEYNLQNPEQFARFKYIELFRIIHAIETIIDQILNHSISLERLLQLHFGNLEGDIDIFEYVVKETTKRLEDYKKQHHVIDVNDLIIKMDEIVERNVKIDISYEYIFIDEFQDTDSVQTKFFAHLANKYKINLFVVGDIKQSIYRFRGADYTAFDQLKSYLEIELEYFLQHNYRTTKQLLNHFNQMFNKWPAHVTTFTFNKEDELISGKETNGDEEDPLIIKRFQTKLGLIKFLEELENTDTGVLLRTNKEVNEFAQLCEANNIFYAAEQDGDFYRSIAVREFYMLIKRFSHPYHWKNRYLLHLSSYGERNLEVSKFINEFSPDRSIQHLLVDKDSFYDQYSERIHKEPLFKVLNEIIQIINPANVYVNRFIADKSPSEKTKNLTEVLYQEYQINLDQLIFLLKKEMTIPTLGKLERLLRMKMQTDKSLSTLYIDDKEIERLRIMTVHKAKGLEFDQVFLPKTNQKFITATQTDVIVDEDRVGYYVNLGQGKTYQNDFYEKFAKREKIENIGEETRLLYVALTRAKKRVYIDVPEISNSHRIRNWGDLIAKSIPKEFAKN